MRSILKIVGIIILLALGVPVWCAESKYDKALDFPLLKLQQQYTYQEQESQSAISSTDHVFDEFAGLSSINDEENRLRASIDAALLLKKRTQALIHEKRHTESIYQKVIQHLSNLKNIFASSISQEVAKRQVQAVRDRKYEVLQRIKEQGLIITDNTRNFIENKTIMADERQAIDKLKQSLLAETPGNTVQRFLNQLELTRQNLQLQLIVASDLVDGLADTRKKNNSAVRVATDGSSIYLTIGL